MPDQSGAGDNKRRREGPGCEIMGHAERKHWKPKECNTEQKVSAVLPLDRRTICRVHSQSLGHLLIFKLNI